MSFGVDVEQLVTRLSIESLQRIVGEDIFETLLLIVDNESFPDSVRRISANVIYNQADRFFSQNQNLDLVLNALSETEIQSLCNRLSLTKKSDILNLTPTSNFAKFNQLLGFFGVDNRAPSLPISEPDIESVRANYSLFEHQRDAANRVWKIIGEGYDRVVLHMPTGAGKTRTAMHIVCKFLNCHEPGVVVWLASSAELLDQAADAFKQAWSSLGAREVQLSRMWGKDNPDLSMVSDGILVAGLQKMHAFSLKSPMDYLRFSARVKLVIVDEAHQAVAPTYGGVINKLTETGAKNALVGLTATPGRSWSDISADEELSNFFSEKKVMLQIEGWADPVSYLISEDYLAKPNFRPLNYPTPQNTLKGDEQEKKSLAEYPSSLMDGLAVDGLRNKIIYEEVEHLISAGHLRIIVFAASVRHAEILSAVLLATGIDARVVTGESSSLNRKRAISAFRAKANQPMVMCNYGVLTTGFDAPQTSAAIIGRPTKSLVLYSQMVGRATRGIKAGGNKNCTISTVLDTGLPGFGDIAEAFTNWEDVWDD